MIAPPFLEIVPRKPRRPWEEQNSSKAFRQVDLEYSGGRASFRKPVPAQPVDATPPGINLSPKGGVHETRETMEAFCRRLRIKQ
jgi:hypothetical protein